MKPVHGLKAPQALTTMVGPKLNTKLYFSITYKQHIINQKKFRVALHIFIPDHHGWTKYYYNVTCKHHMISKDYNRSVTA